MTPTAPPRDSNLTPAIGYAPGIGEAVADRTYNRNLDGYTETWEDVAARVSTGSALLHPGNFDTEFHRMHHHMRKGTLLMAGRHLQHGDEHQPSRTLELYANCATAAASFQVFYLLLNGSGVGRAYDDALMVVDWSKMPIVVPIVRQDHPDVATGEVSGFMDSRTARHMYAGRTIVELLVPDSREGWAQAIELMEGMAHAGVYRDHVLLLDFSLVRERGRPIRGMQNRPASGPGPTMDALRTVAGVRDSGMERWRQAMFVDHHLAESVLVGGIRRAARMSTKTWRDESVLGFISVKQGGFLWSSNNSVTTCGDFWAGVRDGDPHATKVLDALTRAAYFDRTGEPGIINQHLLTQNGPAPGEYPGIFMAEDKYKLVSRDAAVQGQVGTDRVLAADLMAALRDAALEQQYRHITNPCGEVSLLTLGGFCVIGDVVPHHAETDAEAEDACRACARALMRVNTMSSMYDHEVKRTNRIGVGLTGVHEWAWSRFGLGFRDLIDEDKSREFWQTLSRFKRAVVDECDTYSVSLGLPAPHTNTTVKPSGTVSKLFNLTEGVHLPSRKEYLRWVQYRNDNPEVELYRKAGYPTRKLTTYKGTTIVGFPTRPLICTLGMGDRMVTASDATPEEQYRWLRLLEKYWIVGVEEDGETPLADTGNQVSYTLKINMDRVSYQDFRDTLIEHQSQVRACSVLPEVDASAYEYNPEEPVTLERYNEIVAAIRPVGGGVGEDVDRSHVDCASGACPIEFSKEEAATATPV